MECSLFVKQSCLGKKAYYWFKNWFLFVYLKHGSQITAFVFCLLQPGLCFFYREAWSVMFRFKSFEKIRGVQLYGFSSGICTFFLENTINWMMCVKRRENGRDIVTILWNVLWCFSWTFDNLYFKPLVVIIVIIINHQLPDQIEIQNIEKVKAMENTTIFQR